MCGKFIIALISTQFELGVAMASCVFVAGPNPADSLVDGLACVHPTTHSAC